MLFAGGSHVRLRGGELAGQFPARRLRGGELRLEIGGLLFQRGGGLFTSLEGGGQALVQSSGDGITFLRLFGGGGQLGLQLGDPALGLLDDGLGALARLEGDHALLLLQPDDFLLEGSHAPADLRLGRGGGGQLGAESLNVLACGLLRIGQGFGGGGKLVFQRLDLGGGCLGLGPGLGQRGLQTGHLGGALLGLAQALFPFGLLPVEVPGDGGLFLARLLQLGLQGGCARGELVLLLAGAFESLLQLERLFPDAREFLGGFFQRGDLGLGLAQLLVQRGDLAGLLHVVGRALGLDVGQLFLGLAQLGGQFADGALALGDLQGEVLGGGGDAVEDLVLHAALEFGELGLDDGGVLLQRGHAGCGRAQLGLAQGELAGQGLGLGGQALRVLAGRFQLFLRGLFTAAGPLAHHGHGAFQLGDLPLQFIGALRGGGGFGFQAVGLAGGGPQGLDFLLQRAVSLLQGGDLLAERVGRRVPGGGDAQTDLQVARAALAIKNAELDDVGLEGGRGLLDVGEQRSRFPVEPERGVPLLASVGGVGLGEHGRGAGVERVRSRGGLLGRRGRGEDARQQHQQDGGE